MNVWLSLQVLLERMSAVCTRIPLRVGKGQFVSMRVGTCECLLTHAFQCLFSCTRAQMRESVPVLRFMSAPLQGDSCRSC